MGTSLVFTFKLSYTRRWPVPTGGNSFVAVTTPVVTTLFLPILLGATETMPQVQVQAARQNKYTAKQIHSTLITDTYYTAHIDIISSKGGARCNWPARVTWLPHIRYNDRQWIYSWITTYPIWIGRRNAASAFYSRLQRQIQKNQNSDRFNFFCRF